MMNSNQKKELIPLCYWAGLAEDQTASLLVEKQLAQVYWHQPELKRRQNSLQRQQAMLRLVQALHAAGKKDTEISRFCVLSQFTMLFMLAREI
ncbi:hypothetical protein RRR72_003820 [Citrobacter freundii]|uniref:hypothetical protein n=1 Tax=Citrobacter freundii TaxID=546 RepID=UPI0015EA2DA7|nr:hypothetical protein [Citrobacter freundii]ELJ2049639.1 hypothetical protein [Citrobacter freundii]QMN59849.1 hypothetical protein HVW68_18120 [Citrobacter freundii]